MDEGRKRIWGGAILFLLLVSAGARLDGRTLAPDALFAIRTANGRYLTAVNGGGVAGPGALHTDATQIQAWEQFRLVERGENRFAIQTTRGTYLTAVRGGDVKGPDSIHTDATQIRAWEEFRLVSLGGSQYAIQTAGGQYLTAVQGGGVGGADSIHTDATQVQGWEKFTLVPIAGAQPAADCGICAADRCPACAGVVVLMCIASEGPGVNAAACQACIDANCRR